jgi:hypothetical protein
LPGYFGDGAGFRRVAREIVENALSADWSADGSEMAVVHQVGGKYRVEFPAGK